MRNFELAGNRVASAGNENSGLQETPLVLFHGIQKHLFDVPSQSACDLENQGDQVTPYAQRFREAP
jgi:hypothetical protein